MSSMAMTCAPGLAYLWIARSSRMRGNFVKKMSMGFWKGCESSQKVIGPSIPGRILANTSGPEPS